MTPPSRLASTLRNLDLSSVIKPEPSRTSRGVVVVPRNSEDVAGVRDFLKKAERDDIAEVVVLVPLDAVGLAVESSGDVVALSVRVVSGNWGQWPPTRRTIVDLGGRASRTADVAYVELDGADTSHFAPSPSPSPSPSPAVDRRSVTAVIASYRQETVLRLSLPALSAQMVASGGELVVCDDGSEAVSAQAVAAICADLKVPALYCWQPDRGFRVAESRNNGLRLASGVVVILLDGDVVPFPDLVDRHLAMHQEGVFRLVSGARRFAPDSARPSAAPSEVDVAELVETSTAEAIDEDARLVPELEGLHPWRSCFTSNISIGSNTSVRFDELIRNPNGFEDNEFAFRCWQAGADVRVELDAAGIHVGLRRGYPDCLRATGHEGLIRHAETCLYVVGKHREEPYIRKYLTVFGGFILDPAGRWRYSIAERRPFLEGLEGYISWRATNRSHVEDVLAHP